MANGKIVLSLNIGATRANIKSQLDGIINGLKPKVTLDVKIKNKSEIQKLIKDAERLNSVMSKSMKSGSGAKGIASNWGSSINTFKKAEASMASVQRRAEKLGVSIKKADLNKFAKAMSGRDLKGAVNVLRDVNTQLDSISRRSKIAIADFAKINNAKGLLSQVSAMKNVSAETAKQAKVMQRAIATLENPNNTPARRLSAYDTIDKYYGRIASGIKLAKTEASSFSGIDKQMSKLQSSVNRLQKLKAEMQSFGEFTGTPVDASFVSQIDSAVSRFQKLQSVIDKLKSGQKVKGFDLQSAIAEAEKLKAEINSIFTDSKMKSPQAIKKMEQEVRTLTANIQRMGAEWSRMFTDPGFAQRYKNLSKMASNIGIDPKKLQAAKDEYKALSAEVKGAGLNTLTLGDYFKKTFKNFAMFFGASRIIYEGVAAVRQMITNVSQLDSAMVELRKVSDATDSQYNAYFKRSKQSAVEIGTTVHELINSTADFARLGYNLVDAENLAKVATIYQRVGDDIDSVDVATQSIISTMKAFDIQADDAITIVDKFNEVGNNFAISSGGIGDALQRSAASMKAAGNTIDESIALTVAANNVIQDPDVVGKHLPKNVVIHFRKVAISVKVWGQIRPRKDLVV